MNILYINHENSLGGASQSLLGLIDELKDKDVNITVVIPKDGNNALEEKLKNKNINYILLRYSWWMLPKGAINTKSKKILAKLKMSIKNYMATIRLIRICKRLKIDIIHSNSSVINIGGMVKYFTKINHVWHIREFGDDDHNLKFVNGYSNSVKFLSDNSDKVIAISNSIYDKYKETINSNKFMVIYNGVKSSDVNRKYYDNHTDFNILLAGAIKENKGQKQAILAVANLINNECKNIFLYLAGKGEEGYEDELKELVKNLRIEQNVKFLGFTSNLDDIRNKMDVELVCSKKEAFGRVTVEAMMAGNPVIGTNSGGTIELIKPNYNGLLYNDGDVEELSNCIKTFVEYPEKKALMGQNGRQLAMNNFTAKINAMKIYEIYCELLNKK